MKILHFTFIPLILTSSLLSTPALADENELLDEVDPITENDGSIKGTSGQVTNKIAGEYGGALSDNLVADTTSEDIVNGLRQGTAFEYQYTDADGQLITQTIDSNSGMGYGEVRHALTLSEQNGGDLQSVLDMRESGLGWGEIAHQQGGSLGAAKKLPLATGITSGGGDTIETSGVVTGGGESVSVKGNQGKSNNYVNASKGKGVVDAGGFGNAPLTAASHSNAGGNGGGAKASHTVSGGAGIVHGGGNAYGLNGGNNNGKANGKNKD